MAECRLFISYRREDSAAYAGRIYDRLSSRFGSSVFMDIDSISPGEDFVRSLDATLRSCDAVLVIIGRGWVQALDASGQKRLDNPEDLVRMEIAVALKRGIRLIPLLVGGASMPSPDQLPIELSELSLRQAVEISDLHFHRDVDYLIGSLKTRFQNPDDLVDTYELADGRYSGAAFRWVIITESVLVLALVGLSPLFSTVRNMWALALPLGLLIGYIGLRIRVTPCWIMGGLLVPITVGLYGAQWLIHEEGPEDNLLLTWLVNAVLWVSLTTWAIKGVSNIKNLMATPPVLRRLPTWSIVAACLCATVIALYAQGVLEDFEFVSLDYPFDDLSQLLNGCWLIVIVGLATLGERMLERYTNLFQFSSQLWSKGVFIFSGVGLILWGSYSLWPHDWLLLLLRFASLVAAVVGVIALAVGHIRGSRWTVALGWCGIGSLCVLSGGNLWFTVRDPSGAVVGNAKVHVIGEELATHASGSVAAPFSPYAPFTVQVAANGFKSVTYRDMPFPLLFPKRSVVMLEIGPQTQSVSISGSMWSFLPGLAVGILYACLLIGSAVAYIRTSGGKHIAAPDAQM